MSDELRSAPGHRPEQRRNRGAPSWWSELERMDLPEDQTDSTSVPRAPRPAPARPAPRRPAAARRPGRYTRLRTAALTALVVVVAALMAWIGVGGGSLRTVVVVLLVFGVPALLALVTTTIIVRRSG